MLLLSALEVAGEDGLTLQEATVFSGARDERDLRAVVDLLLALELPFEPPYDALPIDGLEAGEVRLYMPTPAAVVPSLTPGELEALRASGVLERRGRAARGMMEASAAAACAPEAMLIAPGTPDATARGLRPTGGWAA